MKPQNRINLSFIAALALGGLILGPAGAFAASTDGTASMTVNDPLTITEDTALNFGTINAPSTDSNTFDLTTDGTMTKTGAGDAFHGADHAVGAWTVAGEAGRSVSVSVAFGAWSDAAISTDAAYINGSSDSATVTLTEGSAALTIGGKVTATSSVTTGAKSATVTVTANYQ